MNTLIPQKLTSVDARWYQIVFLSSFLIIGNLLLNWNSKWYIVTSYIVSCLITQFAFSTYHKAPFDSLLSGMITSLSLSIILKTDLVWVAMLAGVLSISSKFILRINKKHFFNPANFGIVATLYLTNRAWILPGQWGNLAVIFFIVCLAGMAVLNKARRLEVGVAFIAATLLFEYAYNCLYLGWPCDFIWHKMSAGAFLLFSFFMITDPVSTPNHPIARICWTVSVAFLAFILSNLFYIQGAPIQVLFWTSMITPILDYFLKAQKFHWSQTKFQIN